MCLQKMVRFFLILLVSLVCSVLCNPLKNSELLIDTTQLHNIEKPQSHNIEKRFINPMFNLGSFSGNEFAKIRTKRSYEDECEKLELCKLHARSQNNFLAAFQLYFVNKENARLWDHHYRSMADCENRYGDCYKK